MPQLLGKGGVVALRVIDYSAEAVGDDDCRKAFGLRLASVIYHPQDFSVRVCAV